MWTVYLYRKNARISCGERGRSSVSAAQRGRPFQQVSRENMFVLLLSGKRERENVPRRYAKLRLI